MHNFDWTAFGIGLLVGWASLGAIAVLVAHGIDKADGGE